MRASERVLAVEPRHLFALLQKATLLESQGKQRAAAKVYHHALQTIPPGASVPGALRGLITPQSTFLTFPQLPAREFYPRAEFPWLDRLEAAARCAARSVGRAESFAALERFLSVARWLGEAWVFDDSIEHEAWNDSDVSRAILVL